jgi:hypothetical protein
MDSYILYNLSCGFSGDLFGPDNRLQHDIAGTLGNSAWGYIGGTYDKDAGANNQRFYLNGTRIAQMSDTQPIDLNPAAVGIGRHVSGTGDPSMAVSTSSASGTSSAPTAGLGPSPDRCPVCRRIHSAIDSTTRTSWVPTDGPRGVRSSRPRRYSRSSGPERR